MFYLSLALTAILLPLANVTAHRRAGWFLGFYLAAGSPVALSGLVILYPAMLLGVGLAAAMPFWRKPGPNPWLYLPVSLAVAAVAWGVPLWYVDRCGREDADLRGQFPYESMEERFVSPPLSGGPLSHDAEERLASAEALFAEDRVARRREADLLALHEDTTLRFVNSPGFGASRLRRPPSASPLEGDRPAGPVAQPDPVAHPDWPAEGGSWQPISADRLSWLLQESVLDFANPRDFGYAKDRRRVAGFRPHRLTRPPAEGDQRWAVRRVDLVGLLLHAVPVAYVSRDLPNMGELGKVPTRSLDGFESAGLQRLRQGEDLVAGDATGHVRVLGAIRGAAHCVGCHGGARGDLLGAFSYSLRHVDK